MSANERLNISCGEEYGQSGRNDLAEETVMWGQPPPAVRRAQRDAVDYLRCRRILTGARLGIPTPTKMITSNTVAAPTAALTRNSARVRSRPMDHSMEPANAFREVTPRLDLKFESKLETQFRMKLEITLELVMAVSLFTRTIVLQQKNPTFTVSPSVKVGQFRFTYCAGVSATVAAGTSVATSGAATGLIFTVERMVSRRPKTLSRSTCLITPCSDATVVTFSANS